MTEAATADDALRRRVDAWVSSHVTRVPGYLNTATAGLPTRESLDAARDRLTQWQAGRLDPRSFDRDVDRSIAAFALLAGTTADRVAVAGQVASIAGVVAASLPAGASVLCPDVDFTSVLFPFMADQRLQVRTVALDDLLDSIDETVDLVAASAVQSSDGRRLDLDDLAARCAAVGAKTFVDTTQAAGWVAVDADRFDVTACHAYKWLCSPRGVAFMTVSAAGGEWIRPRDAGWYAGADPWESIYGPPLRLAASAARFNVSPAWFSFSGAAPALESLADLGVADIGAHSVGLANRFRSRLGLAASDSAIVSLDLDGAAAARLEEADVRVAGRGGRVRFSFYVYNDVDDVDRVAELVSSS